MVERAFIRMNIHINLCVVVQFKQFFFRLKKNCRLRRDLNHSLVQQILINNKKITAMIIHIVSVFLSLLSLQHFTLF